MENTTMSERIPAELFPPGEFIEEELEARGWSKGDLADVMGRPAQLVSTIISGKRSITLETAEDLAAAFGTSAELWINLDTSYRLWKSRADNPADSRIDVRLKAELYEYAPVNEVIRRKWVPDSKHDIARLKHDICGHLRVSEIGDIPNVDLVARKSADETLISHFAWYYRACDIAKSVSTERYTATRLRKAIEELKSLAKNAEDVRHVPEVLARGGVRLVVVEHLQKTKIDGAAFWLDKKSPVVAMSMRHGRIDYFWHTLGHELGHVVANDGNAIDNELVSGDRESIDSEREEKADAFASEMLISHDRLGRFIARKGKYFSKKSIVGFADDVGVHPGIVVGQLQHRRAISWTHSRKMLVSVRDEITESALTDGWGHCPAI